MLREYGKVDIHLSEINGNDKTYIAFKKSVISVSIQAVKILPLPFANPTNNQKEVVVVPYWEEQELLLRHVVKHC